MQYLLSLKNCQEEEADYLGSFNFIWHPMLVAQNMYLD